MTMIKCRIKKPEIPKDRNVTCYKINGPFKFLAILFFILCIVCGIFQKNNFIPSEAMICLCFAFFLCGMNLLILIKASSDETPPPRP